jgi:hypothetical protein
VAVNVTNATGLTGDPPPAGDPSGAPMPQGDIPGWHQIVTDDFTQAVPLGSFPDAVATKWEAYPYPWKDTSGYGTYDPHKGLSVHDGVLDIWVHHVSGEYVVESPELLATKNLSAGRYVIRFEADLIHHYKTAWMLWPMSNSWPADGEIDFPEGDLDSVICGFMHRQSATSGSDQASACTAQHYQSWHTAVIEWVAGSYCKLILDGTTILDETSRVPSTAMRWNLQTETSLGGGPPQASDGGHIYIDWVAAYVPAP